LEDNINMNNLIQ